MNLNNFIWIFKLLIPLLVIIFSQGYLISMNNVNQDVFPSEIVIKTNTETFNSRYFYIIRDGKIWVKKNTSNNLDNKWKLMYSNGLPYNDREKNFPVPEKITCIYADGDELLALDNKGRFFVKQTKGEGYLSDNLWHHHVGFPKSPLRLDGLTLNNRAISMGRKHSDVLYYEDIFGNEHHYGNMGTSSIYLLSHDGKEIMFTDNGLPADFSHRICGPLRGKFIAQNLQASAGTLFVINQAGQTYTKMEDFDLNGGTSMFFNYTYRPYKSDLSGKDFKSCLTAFGLPLKDWEKQPEILLKGKAKLTKKITILQTGQGNKERELRIAGKNENGTVGFYFKKIFDKLWDFKEADLQLSEGDYLDNIAPDLKSESKDILYTGLISISDKYKFEAVIIDFNLDCSPAKLIINIGNKKAFAKLHTVEAWTFLKRFAPGLDGTKKIFLGTFEIESDKESVLPAELKSLNLETFAFSIQADPWNLNINTINESKKIEMVFTSPESNNEQLKSKAIQDGNQISEPFKEEITKVDLHEITSGIDFKLSNINELKQVINKIKFFNEKMESHLIIKKQRLIEQFRFMLIYTLYENFVLLFRLDQKFPFNDMGTKLLEIYYLNEKKEYLDFEKEFYYKKASLIKIFNELDKKLISLEKKALFNDYNYYGKITLPGRENFLEAELENFNLMKNDAFLIAYKNTGKPLHKEYPFYLLLNKKNDLIEKITFPLKLNGRLSFSHFLRKKNDPLFQAGIYPYFKNKKFLPVKITINRDSIEVIPTNREKRISKFFKIDLARIDAN